MGNYPFESAMKFCAFIAVIVLLFTAQTVLSAPRIRLLAPAEESTLGQEGAFIIGKVEDIENVKMVRISDNGKTAGFAPLRGNAFTYSVKLAEGRHEIIFTVPGVEAKAIKIFVDGKRGYRYHIEQNITSCGNCHAEASRHRFSVSPVQGDMCDQCHDPVGTGEYVHGPVAAGSCTPCHDPHGSSYRKFLVASGMELCFLCHSRYLSKKHTEQTQDAPCEQCHDPHSSSKNYYLR